MGNRASLFVHHYVSPIGSIEIISNEINLLSVLFLDAVTKAAKGFQVTQHLSTPIKLCSEQLTEYFNGSRRKFDLPIQHIGTDFQLKVWAELDIIQFGNTITYLQQSKKIGNEKAIRAVGTCNGKNQFNIIVPCHRVVGSNGALTGYGGDVWRKKWLLEHEQKFTNHSNNGKLF
jgi:methylated-DNA-[protein]-cysteine S-methyltransferase